MKHRRDRAQAAADFEAQMRTGMLKMMEDMHANAPTGDPDIDFLAMMIPHHQGAIDMARLVLLHGRDPLTRNLAEEIIAAQQSEILAMRGRLVQLRQIGAAAEPYPVLSGTRGGAGRDEAP